MVAASANMSQFTKIIWRVGCKIPMALGEKGFIDFFFFFTAAE